MNLLEHFVTDHMQIVTDQMQIVKIAGAGVGRVCVLLREFWYIDGDCTGITHSSPSSLSSLSEPLSSESLP